MMSGQQTVTLPSGATFRVSENDDGQISLTFDGVSGTPLVMPSTYSNVVTIVLWPSFQPIVPPTPEKPVQVPRDLVQQVMSPKSNGVGHEAVEAVKASVEEDPALVEIIKSHIRSVLTKRSSSGGYESVIVRQKCSFCRLSDTDYRPVNQQDGVWAHESCRERNQSEAAG